MSAMTNDRLVLTNANVIDCVGERPIVGGSVVIDRLAQGYDPDKTKAWLADEVGGWVRDFLADHATPADPSGQVATCREFGITDPTGPHARVLLFELASEIAQAVADQVLAKLAEASR